MSVSDARDDGDVDKRVTELRATAYANKRQAGNTFSTITAKVSELAEPDFEKFFHFMYSELLKIKGHREVYFSNLRDNRWTLIFRLRRLLIWLGIVALLSTALAAAAPLVAPGTSVGSGLDKWALLAALAAYAAMGAIGLYERGNDLSASYFRQLEASISIRNIWNKLQLSLLKEYPALSTGADKAASRARVCEIAEEFCTEIDKIAVGERSGWQAAVAQTMEDAQKSSDAFLKAAKAEVSALTTAATTALEKAKEAEAAMVAASRPAHINIKVTGAFDGKIGVAVDGKEVSEEASSEFGLTGLQPGVRKFTLQATKDGRALSGSKVVELKAGVNALEIIALT